MKTPWHTNSSPEVLSRTRMWYENSERIKDINHATESSKMYYILDPLTKKTKKKECHLPLRGLGPDAPGSWFVRCLRNGKKKNRHFEQTWRAGKWKWWKLPKKKIPNSPTNRESFNSRRSLCHPTYAASNSPWPWWLTGRCRNFPFRLGILPIFRGWDVNVGCGEGPLMHRLGSLTRKTCEAFLSWKRKKERVAFLGCESTEETRGF